MQLQSMVRRLPSELFPETKNSRVPVSRNASAIYTSECDIGRHSYSSSRMSSDSELSNDVPDDSTLEAALRSAVVQAKRAVNLHSTTVNTIRASVESKLGLTKDFFKSSSAWKQRSKDVVNAAFVGNQRTIKSNRLTLYRKNPSQSPKPNLALLQRSKVGSARLLAKMPSRRRDGEHLLLKRI